MATLKKAPDSLLRERYYSLSAYALGPDRFVKYSARPCGRALPTDQALNGPDFLRQRLSKEIANGDACFEFLVQKQVDGVNMPVENATVEWPESKSPFVKVATLKIPRQNANTAERNRYCENLSFNPWHALPEHRPAGVMNRVRARCTWRSHAFAAAKTSAATWASLAARRHRHGLWSSTASPASLPNRTLRPGPRLPNPVAAHGTASRFSSRPWPAWPPGMPAAPLKVSRTFRQSGGLMRRRAGVVSGSSSPLPAAPGRTRTPPGN